MSPDTTVIFGPPGTGKTTDLLNRIDQFLLDGMSPDQVCFVGFTRRSAREARERAIEKFKLTEENIPWFKTLHALAFNMMGLSKNNVMGVSDYLSLCKTLGLSITVGGFNNEDGTFAGQTKGDRLFFAECMARSKMMDLKAYQQSVPDEDLYYYELLQLREAVEQYKKNHAKVDFTDIIDRYCDDGITPPPASVLFVDEAQDLSPLQWKMVNKLSDGIGPTFVAGDDDQAIFRWAGADPDILINLPGKRHVLDQSHRIPQKVHVIAGELASRIRTRVKKEWKPRKEEGAVEYASAIQHVDMSQGKWLLLARNTFLLEQFENECLHQGFLYDMKGSIGSRADTLQAIDAWNQVAEGWSVTVGQFRKAYELMESGTRITRGYKGKFDEMKDSDVVDLTILQQNHGVLLKGHEPWEHALNRIPDPEREYYLSAARKGEDLMGTPRIRISTIHGAKGAEADNVVVCTDMAQRTFREMEIFPDDEHRVWYVAVTRARKRLIILQPTSDKCYNI